MSYPIYQAWIDSLPENQQSKHPAAPFVGPCFVWTDRHGLNHATITESGKSRTFDVDIAAVATTVNKNYADTVQAAIDSGVAPYSPPEPTPFREQCSRRIEQLYLTKRDVDGFLISIVLPDAGLQDLNAKQSDVTFLTGLLALGEGAPDSTVLATAYNFEGGASDLTKGDIKALGSAIVTEFGNCYWDHRATRDDVLAGTLPTAAQITKWAITADEIQLAQLT